MAYIKKGPKKKHKVEIECCICKHKYLVWPSNAKRPGHKFCSKECKSEGWKRKILTVPSRYNLPRNISNRVKLKCEYCEEHFEVTKSVYKKNKTRFCSSKCFGLYAKKTECRKRDKNPRWKGGKKTEDIVLRNCDKYKQWRMDVFGRDRFACQKCGQISKDLHAHHIYSFTKMLNELREEFPVLNLIDVANSTDKLWDVNNGITMCKKCHIAHHVKEKLDKRQTHNI